MKAAFSLVLIVAFAGGCSSKSSKGGVNDPDSGSGSQTAMQGGNAGSANGSNKDAGSSDDLDAAMSGGPGSDSGLPMSMLDAGGDAGLIAVVDPAPQALTPGEYTCEGCPDADLTTFELDLANATSTQLFGTVTGAVGNGQFYLESEGGQSIAGAIPTSETGSYSFTLPLFCGTQLLKCLWSNDAGTYVAVTQIVTTECVQADIRVTVTWDELGYDYELHLIKEGGQINDNATDCTWTSCIGAGPDWGVVGDTTDNPLKDVDNTGNYGPENIFYANPEDGTYTVMVEHWGGGTADSDGEVTINLAGEQTVAVKITNLASHHVFTAATIEWPSKVVNVVGSDYDCTANFAGGCRDAIP
ncbi:MAG TPA: hypothetical protein VHO25_01500 [Polyangiaceae bacterium]|nr:hypothetical protein [Polyangiaceae bacterium]